MDRFAFDQHRDVFFEPGGPGLGLLGILQAVKNREAVVTIQSFEEPFGLLVLCQCGAKVFEPSSGLTSAAIKPFGPGPNRASMLSPGWGSMKP